MCADSKAHKIVNAKIEVDSRFHLTISDQNNANANYDVKVQVNHFPPIF